MNTCCSMNLLCHHCQGLTWGAYTDKSGRFNDFRTSTTGILPLPVIEIASHTIFTVI